MPVTKVNKQTSGGGTCGGVDAGGSAELCSMWSPICNASEYTEELWRCFGDALEMHWKSAESDVQGCTLTVGSEPIHGCWPESSSNGVQ